MSILKIKDSQGNWVGVPTVKGDTGNGIQSAVLNNDYTLTLTFTDGTTYTTPSIRGEKGEQGEPATDMEIHICSSNEYDSETRIPTITNPDDKTFYLVPTEDGTSPDLFTEWVYVNNAWEMFGSASVDLSGYLTDVQVNRTSVVTDGVANIPKANSSTHGVVKVNSDYGIGKMGDGSLTLMLASERESKDGANMYNIVAPINQHISAFYGLAKASGTDEKDSTLPLGQYSDEAKSSIQDMLDVPSNADLDEVEEKVEQNTEDLLKAFPVETVSGNIVSFEDGANDIPLQSLVVDINPIQDLHGYDSPWVGGGGKNLFDESKAIANATYTYTDGEWSISAPYGQGGRVIQYTDGIPVSNGQVITISADVKMSQGSESTNKQICVGAKDSANNGSYPKTDITLSDFDTWERVSAQVTTTSDYVWVGIQPRNSDTNNVVTFKNVQVEVGSTATDWTPYENICPISGWTGCMIYDFGDNLFDYENDVIKYNYYRNDDGDEVSSTSSFYTETSYDIEPYQYIRIAASNDFSVRVYCLTQDNQWISRTPWYMSVNNALTIINPESNCHKIQLHFSASMSPDLSTLRLSIGHHLIVRWQSEAGTVYGGKLDVLSGVLSVDRYVEDLSQKSWTTRYTGNEHITLSTSLTNAYPRAKGNQIISENYALNSVSGVSTLSDSDNVNVGLYWYNNTASLTPAVIYVVTNVDVIPSGLIVYPLAEPITIKLTPTEVRSLLGTNNIFADTGDTEVEYRADPDLYIQRKMPEVPVDDVQINGTSIVENGVAEIPVAIGTAKLGLMQTSALNGIRSSNNGTLSIYSATVSELKAGTHKYNPVVANTAYAATFYGLAKSAGDTTQSQSSNAVGSYTDNAKDKIQTMLGVSPLIAPHESDPFESAHVIGELFIINGKLYRAKTALTAGEYINEGTNVEVVSVAGVLDDTYVKNTDYATNTKGGTVKVVNPDMYGLKMDTTGRIEVFGASENNIKVGTAQYRPVTVLHQHEATFYGLAKASGDTTQSQSDNAVGTYTSEAKTTIKQMLGVHDTYDSFIEEVTGTDVTITGQPSYRYNCGELYSLTVTPPSSGTIDFRFTSGSTPTVLTLPSTVKMPEWWVEVETNTIYEMCITDGIYCGVMTWAV